MHRTHTFATMTALSALLLVFCCSAVYAEKGKTITAGPWSITLPADWNGDADANVYWPGKGSLDRGLPPVSLHCGGIPVMPGTSFEERVKRHIGTEPQDRSDVTIKDFSGFTCNWEHHGKKHAGLFLHKKIGSGMVVIRFFDCRAPAAEFAQYKDVFASILKSVKK